MYQGYKLVHSELASGKMSYDVSKLKILGVENYSVVYKLNETTALKVVSFGSNRDLKRITQEEIEELLKLNRQDGPGREHLIEMKGYDDEQDRIYVRMELAQGNMASHMKTPDYQQMSLYAKIDVIRQAFSGLEFLHTREPPAVHQGLKPAHILLFPGMHVKHCSIGLKRSTSHSLEKTVAYMAPEVLVNGMTPEPSADIWAMCCVAVEWFTGRLPWHHDEKKDDLKEIVMAKQKKQIHPEELKNVPEIVLNTLTLGLDYRFARRPSAQNMRELMEEHKEKTSLPAGVAKMSITKSAQASKPASAAPRLPNK